MSLKPEFEQLSRPFEYLPVLLAFRSVEGHWPSNTQELEGFVTARGFDMQYNGFTNLVLKAGENESLTVEYDLLPPLAGHWTFTFSMSTWEDFPANLPDREINDMLQSVLGEQTEAKPSARPLP